MSNMSEIIYWTLVDSSQISLENKAGFLSPAELQKLSTLRFPKRRNEWLLGRWAAKSLVQSIPAYQHYSLDEIEIQNGSEGAPCIRPSGGSASPDCLTISHSGQFALCALAPGLDLRVGADLEKIEPRTEMFILDYFTTAERELIDSYPAETRTIVVTLIWSAKESMLKALGVGLHWDTRQVEILEIGDLIPGDANHDKWQKMQVSDLQQGNRHWAAWWQRRSNFVLTLAGFTTMPANIQSVLLVEKRIQKEIALKVSG
jgi:4'-phosphopantetheinyl transferase